MSLREEIAKLLFMFDDDLGLYHGIHKFEELPQEKRIHYIANSDRILYRFEKRIDEIYHRDIHSVILYQKIKEMLK